jgi:hypothetical protein
VRRIAMRWTASRSAAIAVAAIAGTLAVTGCAQTKLGAAALYGNQRISSSKLAAEVANLNAAYQRYQTKVQISYRPAEMPREALSWMLRFATADRLAAQRGIVVSPAQAQHELAVETTNVRQSGDTLTEAAVLNGLPPDLLPQLGTWISVQVQVDNQIDHGVTPTTTSGSNALSSEVSHLQCLAAKSLDIDVNPQYGVYDYAQFAVVAAPSTLAITSPAPGATPAPSPQTTPKC